MSWLCLLLLVVPALLTWQHADWRERQRRDVLDALNEWEEDA